MSLGQILETTSKQYPRKIAIAFHGKEVSFQELNLEVNRVANTLNELNIKTGDRICLYMPNCPEFIFCHFGILKLGAITVPINSMYKSRELKYIVQNSQAGTLITNEVNFSFVFEARPGLPTLKNVILISKRPAPDTISYEELTKKASPDSPKIEVRGEDLAVIGYTSGTTGPPKGAMITHSNYISNISTLAKIWKWTDQDRTLLALPMFHQHGLAIAVHGVIYTGSSMVLMERFNAEEALKLIQKYRCTLFTGVPTMYIHFLNVQDPKKYGLSSMRLFISGSAPLPMETFRKFKETYGFEILERYGLTETLFNTSNPYEGKRKPGAVGLPLLNIQVRIVDEKHQDVPPGEIGEIIIKGPNVMKGYWNMPEETTIAFRNGWFHTGDLGKVDEDGYITIVSRRKEMIIASGFKVYPREIEEVLCSHPKIKEAAVVGIPDAVRGETIKAYVVLKPGETATQDEIIVHCRNSLAAFKAPRQVAFLESLPRTESGKIIKETLTNFQTVN